MKKAKLPCPICFDEKKVAAGSWVADEVSLERWVIDAVDQYNVAQMDEANRRGGPPRFLSAIQSAELGNIEPLRRRFPDLARFLHLPPRMLKKGQKWKDRRIDYDRHDFAAVELVPHVKQAWAEHRKDLSLQHRRVSVGDLVQVMARAFNLNKRVVLAKLKNASRSRQRFSSRDRY